MIRKAVIPVAGLGTRLLPLSKAVPKELVAVVDRPAIQWVIDEACAVGITEIILVTRPEKAAIEQYLLPDEKLNADLHSKGKTVLLEKLGAILPPGVTVTPVIQDEPKGLGHAVAVARQAVGDEPFVVLLPDVLVVAREGQSLDLQGMVQRYQQTHSAQILVAPVPEERVSAYGIVDLAGASLAAGEAQPMRGVVEKPEPAQAPSNLSVVGRYVLPPAIFDELDNTPPGAGGEIQLTDALLALLSKQQVEAYCLAGDTYDCGDMWGLFEAQLSLAVSTSAGRERYQRILETVYRRLQAGEFA